MLFMTFRFDDYTYSTTLLHEAWYQTLQRNQV